MKRSLKIQLVCHCVFLFLLKTNTLSQHSSMDVPHEPIIDATSETSFDTFGILSSNAWLLTIAPNPNPDRLRIPRTPVKDMDHKLLMWNRLTTRTDRDGPKEHNYGISYSELSYPRTFLDAYHDTLADDSTIWCEYTEVSFPRTDVFSRANKSEWSLGCSAKEWSNLDQYILAWINPKYGVWTYDDSDTEWSHTSLAIGGQVGIRILDARCMTWTSLELSQISEDEADITTDTVSLKAGGYYVARKIWPELRIGCSLNSYSEEREHHQLSQNAWIWGYFHPWILQTQISYSSAGRFKNRPPLLSSSLEYVHKPGRSICFSFSQSSYSREVDETKHFYDLERLSLVMQIRF